MKCIILIISLFFNINAFSVENNNPDIPTPEQSNIYNAFNRVRAVAGFRGIITSMSFHNGFWEIDIAKGSKTKTYSFNAVSFKKKFKEEKKIRVTSSRKE